MPNNIGHIRKMHPFITLRYLAESAGVSREAIRLIQNGGDCRLSVAAKLAEALNLSIDQLFTQSWIELGALVYWGTEWELTMKGKVAAFNVKQVDEARMKAAAEYWRNNGEV